MNVFAVTSAVNVPPEVIPVPVPDSTNIPVLNPDVSAADMVVLPEVNVNVFDIDETVPGLPVNVILLDVVTVPTLDMISRIDSLERSASMLKEFLKPYAFTLFNELHRLNILDDDIVPLRLYAGISLS